MHDKKIIINEDLKSEKNINYNGNVTYLSNEDWGYPNNICSKYKDSIIFCQYMEDIDRIVYKPLAIIKKPDNNYLEVCRNIKDKLLNNNYNKIALLYGTEYEKRSCIDLGNYIISN